MKKILAILMVAVLFALPLCLAEEQAGEKTGVTVRVASLKGPTTMGLVKLMQDNDAGTTANEYTFQMEATADAITPLLVRGELDIAMVPCNLAAVVINKTHEMERACSPLRICAARRSILPARGPRLNTRSTMCLRATDWTRRKT